MNVSITLDEREYEAITEYAKMCGESTFEIIKKILMQEVAFMKYLPKDIPQEYDFHMLIPDGVSDDEKLVEENYNKIRDILGLKKIKLG